MADTSAIIKTIIHPQWGAPMDYHVLDKYETDNTAKTTRLQYNSYYNKNAYDSGGMYMTSTVIRLKEPVFADALEISEYIVMLDDNVLSGGDAEAVTAQSEEPDGSVEIPE